MEKQNKGMEKQGAGCESFWGYVDINLLNVVNNKQATKKYQLIDPKTGDVQVVLQAGRPT